jgi:hypothetical protein
MKTYIVRIYRFEEQRPLNLVGVLEEVGVEGRKAFSNFGELSNLLKASLFPSSQKKRKKKIGKEVISKGPSPRNLGRIAK